MYNRLWLHLYKRKYTRNWEFAYNKMDVRSEASHFRYKNVASAALLLFPVKMSSGHEMRVSSTQIQLYSSWVLWKRLSQYRNAIQEFPGKCIYCFDT